MRRIRRALFLPAAWVALRLIRAMLGQLGYRRTVRVLARFSPRPRRIACSPRMPLVAQAIERVDGWWPNQTNGCLRRSLLFWWLFRWLRYDTEVCTGIRRESGEFKLHAWVQCKDVVLNDNPGEVSRYTLLWQDLSSSVIEAGGRT